MTAARTENSHKFENAGVSRAPASRRQLSLLRPARPSSVLAISDCCFSKKTKPRISRLRAWDARGGRGPPDPRDLTGPTPVIARVYVWIYFSITTTQAVSCNLLGLTTARRTVAL